MIRKLLIAGAVLLAPSVALAQDATRGFSMGESTFTLSGSGINSDDFEDGAFGLSASYSYFLLNNVELGVRQDVTWADNEDSKDAWNGATRLAADYNFDFGGMVPFVGASVGYIYGDTIENIWVLGPEAGLRFFVNPTTFLYGQTSYQMDLEDLDLDEGAWIHNVGVGFTF